MNIKHSNLTKIISPIALVAVATFALSPSVLADTLKGGVQQADRIKQEMQGLGRGDLGKGNDPFAGANDSKKEDDGGMLQAPPGAYDSNPFPGKPMQASAQDSGGADFSGKNMTPLMEDTGTPQHAQNDFAPPQQSGAQQNQMNGDIDKSQAMMLLWDAWHKRVAEVIYTRFNNSAQMFFKHSPPLACQVSYMVARDGRIGNVRILQPSNNPIYNTMLITVIKSMAGNPALEYPPNSKRQFVEKSGTFTWNYTGGQGFKYFTGDKEQVKSGGR